MPPRPLGRPHLAHGGRLDQRGRRVRPVFTLPALVAERARDADVSRCGLMNHKMVKDPLSVSGRPPGWTSVLELCFRGFYIIG